MQNMKSLHCTGDFLYMKQADILNPHSVNLLPSQQFQHFLPAYQSLADSFAT